MKSCSYCNSTILFSGISASGLTFCNQRCHQSGLAMITAQSLPADLVDEQVDKVRSGPCPKCQRQGAPVDAHTAHFIWSALVFTSWSSNPTICCRSCGVKNQILSTVGSAVIGWWGFPWGLFMTPVQIFRNLAALCSTSDSRPSPLFRKLISINLASYVLAQQQANHQPEAASRS